MIKINNNGKFVVLQLTNEEQKVVAEAHISPDDVMNDLILQLAAHAMIAKDPEMAEKSATAAEEKTKQGDDRPAFEIFMEEMKQMCKETAEQVESLSDKAAPKVDKIRKGGFNPPPTGPRPPAPPASPEPPPETPSKKD